MGLGDSVPADIPDFGAACDGALSLLLPDACAVSSSVSRSWITA